MLASSYLSDERIHIYNSVRYLGYDWGIKRAKELLDKIAQDPDMTPAQKELESHFFEVLIEDCSKRAEEIRKEQEEKSKTSFSSSYNPSYYNFRRNPYWEDEYDDDNGDFFNGQRIYYTDPETGERSVWGYDSMSS